MFLVHCVLLTSSGHLKTLHRLVCVYVCVQNRKLILLLITTILTTHLFIAYNIKTIKYSSITSYTVGGKSRVTWKACGSDDSIRHMALTMAKWLTHLPNWNQDATPSCFLPRKNWMLLHSTLPKTPAPPSSSLKFPGIVALLKCNPLATSLSFQTWKPSFVLNEDVHFTLVVVIV